MIQIESQASKKVELDSVYQNSKYPKEFQINENEMNSLKISNLSDLKSDHNFDKKKESQSEIKPFENNNQEIIYEDPVDSKSENEDKIIKFPQNTHHYGFNKNKSSLPQISEEMIHQNENNNQLSTFNSKHQSSINENMNYSQQKNSYPSGKESIQLKVVNTSNIDITDNQEPLKIQKLKESLSLNKFTDIPTITLYEGNMDIFLQNEFNKQKQISINSPFSSNKPSTSVQQSKPTPSFNKPEKRGQEQLISSALNNKQESISNDINYSYPPENSYSKQNLSGSIHKQSLNYQNNSNQSNIQASIRNNSVQSKQVSDLNKISQSNLRISNSINNNKIHESINLSQPHPNNNRYSNVDHHTSINSNQKISKIASITPKQSINPQYPTKNSENTRHIVNFKRISGPEVTNRHSSSSIKKIYSTDPFQPRISTRRISYKKSIGQSNEIKKNLPQNQLTRSIEQKLKYSSNLESNQNKNLNNSNSYVLDHSNRITFGQRSMNPQKVENNFSSSARQIRGSSDVNIRNKNEDNTTFDEYGGSKIRRPVLVEDNGEYKRYQYVSRSRSRVRYVDQDNELKSTLKPVNFSNKNEEYNYLKDSYGPEKFNEKLKSLRKSHQNVRVVRGNQEFLKSVYYRD